MGARPMTERDIVIVSVDRSNPDIVLVNTAVEFLHCPVKMPKATLRALGYKVYRPVKIKPIVNAVVMRHAARNGGKIPLGGIVLDPDDLEGLPPNPAAK